MATRSRILIVEDDARIAAVTARNLESAGFECRQVASGVEAVREFEKQEPDLILLDLMLPGIDGLEVTRRIRRTSRVPILMVTSRNTEADTILGLEVGADDYVTKPFGMRELLARVRALLRRAHPAAPGERIVRGGMVIDVAERSVLFRETPIEVTSLEFDLLLFLARSPRRVFTRDALMEQVWGEDRVVDSRSIDSLVSRLRRKLAAIPEAPDFIRTVWGAGYRFHDPGDGGGR